MRKWFMVRVSQLFVLALLITALGGCGEERVVSDDPAEIEKQRQEHLEMTRREMQER